MIYPAQHTAAIFADASLMICDNATEGSILLNVPVTIVTGILKPGYYINFLHSAIRNQFIDISGNQNPEVIAAQDDNIQANINPMQQQRRARENEIKKIDHYWLFFLSSALITTFYLDVTQVIYKGILELSTNLIDTFYGSEGKIKFNSENFEISYDDNIIPHWDDM